MVDRTSSTKIDVANLKDGAITFNLGTNLEIDSKTGIPKPSKKNTEVKCVWWDAVKKEYSTTGVTLEAEPNKTKNLNSVKCRSNHLTSFTL